MWKEFSVRYITQNKLTSIFLAGITFIAATLLSLITSVFYNLWMDFIAQRTAKNPDYIPGFEAIVIAYIIVLIAASVSLVVMIHNAFEVSMNSRVHQMGILQSIGATPKQVRSILLQEACVLCIVPIVIGVLLGVLLCYILVQVGISFSNYYDEYISIQYEVRFYYNVIVGILSIVVSLITVIVSAWIPAQKLSKLSPMEAIYCGEEVSVKRMKRYSLFSSLFGVYGELARKSIYSRRKMLRTTTLSLALSFLSFISFLSFEIISFGFVEETYFERYKDIWDVMITTDHLQNEEDIYNRILTVDGVENCIEYKKIEGNTSVSSDLFSLEVNDIGIEKLSEDFVPDQNGNYNLDVPIFVLDNQSFETYCANHDVSTDGNAVLVNKAWDSVNSTFSNAVYIPFFQTDVPLSFEITNPDRLDGAPVVITADAFTDSMPTIKEELSDHAIHLIVSENLYQTFSGQFPFYENYYNIKIDPDADETQMIAEFDTVLGANYEYTVMGRQTEGEKETVMQKGIFIFISAMASFLACIGLSNVFSATLGQMKQRKKEFARYFSLGISPKGIKKILLSEALIISLRPLLLSVLINIPILAWALDRSGIPLNEFMKKAPYLPAAGLTLAVFLLVGLAYYLSGRQLFKENIITILKDETLGF